MSRPISRRRVVLLLIFCSMFLVGVVMLAFAEVEASKGPFGGSALHDWRVIGIPLLQHLASALIVASVMGVTYEYFVHKHVVDDFDRLLHDHERVTETTFNAFRATTSRDVFTLIGNIAAHINKMPTLFDPPRSGSEVVFATDDRFFTKLIGSEKARAEALEVIGSWLESPLIQLRFLASDFVGLLYLNELAQRVRELATERQKGWPTIQDDERSCILNYWWAASRCEEPRYQLLRERLIDWHDPFVQKWILFVAQQMPDEDLAQMVKAFLKESGSEAAKDVLAAALAAIGVLHNTGYNMRETVNRNRPVFQAAGLWAEACAAVSAVPASTKIRGLRARVRRLFN